MMKGKHPHRHHSSDAKQGRHQMMHRAPKLHPRPWTLNPSCCQRLIPQQPHHCFSHGRVWHSWWVLAACVPLLENRRPTATSWKERRCAVHGMHALTSCRHTLAYGHALSLSSYQCQHGPAHQQAAYHNAPRSCHAHPQLQAVHLHTRRLSRPSRCMLAVMVTLHVAGAY